MVVARTLTAHAAIFCAAAMLFLAPADAGAAIMYGTAATMTGSRSVSGGGLEIVYSDGKGNWDDAAIAWSVELLAGETPTYRYTYTFTDFEKPALSHISLDLTNDAISGSSLADPNAITNLSFDGNAISVGSDHVEFGDVEGIVGGVKFQDFDELAEDGVFVIRFDSNRAPVWGHIQVEQGQASADPKNKQYLLQSADFDDYESEDIASLIARPNGSPVYTPEPASAMLMGLGTLTIMVRSRRRR